MNSDSRLGYARWRPHPWHGLEPGPDRPRIVNAFIEITPFDLMKYEVDKATGYLRADRPQRTVGRYGYEDAAGVVGAAIEDYREVIGRMSESTSGARAGE